MAEIDVFPGSWLVQGFRTLPGSALPVASSESALRRIRHSHDSEINSSAWLLMSTWIRITTACPTPSNQLRRNHHESPSLPGHRPASGHRGQPLTTIQEACHILCHHAWHQGLLVVAWGLTLLTAFGCHQCKPSNDLRSDYSTNNQIDERFYSRNYLSRYRIY